MAVVRIGPAPVEFRVEVAQTAEQQRAGLGGRQSLSEGTGMLFRFGTASLIYTITDSRRWPLSVKDHA